MSESAQIVNQAIESSPTIAAAPAFESAPPASTAPMSVKAPETAATAEPITAIAVTPETDSVKGAWRDQLSDTYKSSKYLNNFDSLDDVVKSYINAQDFIRKGIKNASPEEKQAFYKDMGVPESANDYKLLLPEGATRDEKNEAWFKETARAKNLNQEQAQGVYEAWNEYQALQIKEHEAALAQEEASSREELRKIYGAGLDGRLKMAQKAVNDGGDELFNVLKDKGLLNSVPMIKLLSQMGENLMEEQGINAATTPGYGMTPVQAQTELDNLMAQPDWRKAWLTKSDPGHNKAVQERARLFAIIHEAK